MHLRNATPADRDELIAFSNKFDGPNVSTFDADFFQWQFEDAKALAEAEDNGVLIGIQKDDIVALAYGSKNQVYVDGKIVPGIWQQAWFSDPDVAGSGLFPMREQMRRNPFIVASGQNYNAASVNERLRKMTWFNLRRLFLVLDCARTEDLAFVCNPHARRFLDLSRVRDANGPSDATVIGRFDATYDRCWWAFRRTLTFATDRTAAYMNWRYVDHPRFKYTCACVDTSAGFAYFVWRKESVTNGVGAVGRICEAIGPREAIRFGMRPIIKLMEDDGIIFADFFCSHGETCAALMSAGMRELISTDELDLPRLFQPLANDEWKTLNFYYSFSDAEQLTNFFDHHKTYITKGDSNQDRPNP